MRTVIGAFLVIFAANTCLAIEIQNEGQESYGDVPVLGVVVKQVVRDRLDCVLTAQKNSKSTPSFSVLFVTDIDRNLGPYIKAGDVVRQALRSLADQVALKPEIAKPASAEDYLAHYKACMRAKGYAQN
jgi:hypothetical protein